MSTLIEAIARGIESEALNLGLAATPEDARRLADESLSTLTHHASENFDFADLGDGWVLVKKPGEFPELSAGEIADAKATVFQTAVKIVEQAGTHVVVPVTITPEMNTALNSYAQCEGYIEEGYVAMLSARPKGTTT